MFIEIVKTYVYEFCIMYVKKLPLRGKYCQLTESVEGQTGSLVEHNM
jgi:hypothetical protein